MKERIVIIGGGLSGLTLAYLLSKRDCELKVLEASTRLGGRIQTVNGKFDTPLELGATWFSSIHKELLALIEELDLTKYHQYSGGISLFETKSFEPPQEFSVSESESPSYRLKGGTQELINVLSQKLRAEDIRTSTKVTSISEQKNELLLVTATGDKIYADKAVICIPAQLANSHIRYTPSLPTQMQQLLPTVQTWMAGSIKFVLEYNNPFWRNNGYSGMVYSHVGIVSEMYDHTNYEENKFGFTGFLKNDAGSYSQEERKEMVLKQFTNLLGKNASHPVLYNDKIWVDEYIMSDDHLYQRPHQHNGHPLLQQSYMNDKLFFSGTETDAHYGGYMEGAVRSAIRIANSL